MYVQYGCGFCAPPGWRNFDASPTLFFDRIPLVGRLYIKNEMRFPENVEYGDIVRGLPIREESCDGVYCSHVLEHLSLEGFRSALKNTIHILKPGGIFRLVMPDLEDSVQKYIRNPAPDAAISFMIECCTGREKSLHSMKDVLIEILGSNHHLWLWDYKSLREELRQAGFIGIRRAKSNDSRDPRFQEVEDPARWDNLGAECFRPE